MKLYVNPIVGRTGLSNMLFCWARAELYCTFCGAHMLAPQWTNFFRIGPWLRGERDKRYYLNMFTADNAITGLKRQWLLRSCAHVQEGDLFEVDHQEIRLREERLSGAQKGAVIVDCEGMGGLFDPILMHQEHIRERLWKITAPAIREAVNHMENRPFIGVHIRRGDFSHIGLAIPDAWYVKAVQQAVDRLSHAKGGEQSGAPLIRVFSDACPETLQFLPKAFAHVEIMPKAPALQDLWALSKASIIVGTSRSTFSMWAVYLGQMPSYWHPNDLMPRLNLRDVEQMTVLPL